MSHNLCAFPSCTEPLVEGETVVGEICHIKGEKPRAARYDESQTEDERHGYENLVLMCRKHHRIIDNEEENYPVEKLITMKAQHEESDSRRYTISDELVQRLGTILASETDSGVRAQAVPYPDMTIRELFFHIQPDLFRETRWVEVGREVMDHFSTGRLKVWGRPIYPVGRKGPMKAVDERGYWMHAQFSYWFLKENGQQSPHTLLKTETRLPDYADLQVNREEALKIWPEPGRSTNDPTEIMLLDAARRAYSETRGLPAADHAEMSNASPAEILKWYCVFIGSRTQIFGARHPSTKIEPVNIDNPKKDFDIVDNELTLRELYTGVVWENLRIKASDLTAIVHALRKLGRE